ncbi:MAG: bifunctional (p)ppGpp synthetase/guanosine-3',5'-bis(diphosphate) 3'-pyrophosphohydrolase [Candidatus Nomurabacteria bacterium]|nr:MAG: bifunctional (p)ppGpp synthetase/guanosine-3',5'-bis(diphosphate) 3'-pyrophosphohydrolase [Candidatus Nomurabacteria bacterium]
MKRSTKNLRKVDDGSVNTWSADDFVRAIQAYDAQADVDIVRLAYEYAEQAHQGQMRKNGEPHFTHCIATAARLTHLHLDPITISAALLHDVVEDTPITEEQLKKDFGAEITKLVMSVTKLGKIKYRGMERYVENIRRMFVAMAEDVRVILIKLSDRIHNLSTLSALPREKQLRIATESLEIYAAIANRLGIGEFRGQIEDLAFRYVHPDEYIRIEALFREHYPHAEKFLLSAQHTIAKEFADAGIVIVSCHGRKKHLYSLWKKLQRPELNGDIHQINDLIALRIIVKDVPSCYMALGKIHELWKPIKGKIKDYIAQPKPNGYQSLHTTVFGPHGRIIEIQIRDTVMHEFAEYGIAAHWHYSESGKPKGVSQVPKRMTNWMQALTQWKKEFAKDQEYLESLKVDVFKNQIYVFTPEGDVVELPEDATPVDFAYRVHTDVGNQCSGARVNEKIVALDTPLRSGDVVEILKEKKRKRPNRDWLDFVKTHSAKEQIRKATR